MSFLKSLYNKLHPAPVTGAPASTPGSRQEAAEALQKADTDLHAVISQKPGVDALTGQLKSQLERNHFAELLTASMGPK